jgi:oxygen-independent coproporphyrinogen-3 oxidase
VLPDPDLAAALYEATAEAAARFNMYPYEVSNYAAFGAESRHNLAYWRYADYAGIGPGAHGRLTINGNKIATRRHRAPEIWADRVEQHSHGSTAEETIAPRDRAREALLMGLRLTEGVTATRFHTSTGVLLNDALDPAILAASIEAGYVTHSNGILATTASGRNLLDALLPRLLA